MKKQKQVSMTTNTAYLLNMWFTSDFMWMKVKEFIKEAHEEKKNKYGSQFVRVTFKIVKVK